MIQAGMSVKYEQLCIIRTLCWMSVELTYEIRLWMIAIEQECHQYKIIVSDLRGLETCGWHMLICIEES